MTMAMAMAMAMAAAAPCTARVAANGRIFALSPSQPSQCAPSRTRYHAHHAHALPRWRLHSTRRASSQGALCSSTTGRRARAMPRAVIRDQEQAAAVGIKEFLEDLKAVGRTRLIVNTGVAVLESTVTNLDKLFYHVVPGRGEYANLMLKEENVDFHLLIDKVVSAKLETGKSMRGDIPTYMIRFMDNNGAVTGSLLVMWKPGSNGDFDDGQVEAYQNLVKKYGSDITFAANSSQ